MSSTMGTSFVRPPSVGCARSTSRTPLSPSTRCTRVRTSNWSYTRYRTRRMHRHRRGHHQLRPCRRPSAPEGTRACASPTAVRASRRASAPPCFYGRAHDHCCFVTQFRERCDASCEQATLPFTVDGLADLCARNPNIPKVQTHSARTHLLWSRRPLRPDRCVCGSFQVYSKCASAIKTAPPVDDGMAALPRPIRRPLCRCKP